MKIKYKYYLCFYIDEISHRQNRQFGFSVVQANRDGSPVNGERRTPLLDRVQREAANELAGRDDESNSAMA